MTTPYSSASLGFNGSSVAKELSHMAGQRKLPLRRRMSSKTFVYMPWFSSPYFCRAQVMRQGPSSLMKMPRYFTAGGPWT